MKRVVQRGNCTLGAHALGCQRNASRHSYGIHGIAERANQCVDYLWRIRFHAKDTAECINRLNANRNGGVFKRCDPLAARAAPEPWIALTRAKAYNASSGDEAPQASRPSRYAWHGRDLFYSRAHDVGSVLMRYTSTSRGHRAPRSCVHRLVAWLECLGLDGHMIAAEPLAQQRS